MGVTGLWKLIEPCGQPVPVEILENKVLAIDISIWLHQVVKGFQDNKGSALANSHLLGLFHRLCKLMFYRIKPVFVFDGKVPLLKRETIAKRNQKRNKLVNEAERIQNLLLQSLAKEKVVQQALGTKATEELLKASPSKSKTNEKCKDEDIFKLPDLPKLEQSTTENEDEPSCSSESDSSFCESKPRINYNQNLQAIDVKSEHFRNLPPDIRHEILIDIKETRKQSSWGKLHELPAKSNDFSTFQMKRLLKRRQVQESIEEVQKEMDGVRTFTLSELEDIFTEEGIIETSSLSGTKHISSDSNTRYLLVRDLKETLANAALEENKVKLENNSKKPKIEEAEKNHFDLEEADLERAIQMSLDDAAPYSESDYCYRKEGRKLNSEQRAVLRNAGVGLARDFMIEHACMNDEDVQSLLENTQINDELNYNSCLQDKNQTIITSNESLKIVQNQDLAEASSSSKNELLKSSILIKNEEISQLDKQSPKSPKISEEDEEIGIISDSNSDSDLEEVKDISQQPSNSVISKTVSKEMEIFVDPSKAIDQEEDIFADVFKPTEDKKIEVKKTSLNVSDILQDLKKQAAEVTKINLSDIKLNTQTIDVSDDESVLSQKLVYDTDSDSSENIPTEVIPKSMSDATSLPEAPSVLERDDIEKASKSLDGENLLLPIKSECNEVIEIIDNDLSEKSATNLTPSKTRDISNFFETKFIIKRTPEKKDEIEDVPKVTPPFFVRKSPKSSSEKKRSSTNHDDSPLNKSRKVNKMLFNKSVDEDDDEGFTEIKEIVDKEEDMLEVAAMALKEKKSTEELEDMASTLAKEKRDLEKERNRQGRMGMTITEKMNSECMELLRLFGVPFIVAPMEAEAQCAFLDTVQLTNGTITDDSDIWLFGGRTVYKNFFAQNKHVMEFKCDTIQSSFNVDRNKLIQLALLVGSDYTTGINGIGAVTALEILATFTPKDLAQVDPSQQTSTVLTSLINFREWWKNTKTNTVIGSSVRHRLRNKLANIEVYEEFPSTAVAEAYLKPTVDNNQNSFSWGTPDVESIREFTRANFGWTRNKTDEILGPVLKKLNEKTSQSAITNYFSIKSVSSSSKQLAVSKRVQQAINSMSADFKPDEEVDKEKPKKQRKKRLVSTTADSTNNDEISPKKNKRVSKKKVNLPPARKSEVIPQRQKDQEEMEQKKKLAAEMLKQSKQKRGKNN
ncbi:DNA excision repair protein ERCC-5 homolog [Eupeodes corollae]|uniref:DNA excision repair protein ERCC-5 homolog n=1 Tax=Eupeodes corollae TaxID=290404 RepID=UPI002491A217|nr:DNA excision repair protein ERCC-5 homolog [Eupeodes corollae]